MKELSRKGKISLSITFSSGIAAIMYMLFIMDGRTTLNEKDSVFIWAMVIIGGISIVITLADRARTRGGEFSGRKFGIILLIVILFGLWKLSL